MGDLKGLGWWAGSRRATESQAESFSQLQFHGQYSLSTYCVSGTVVDTGDPAVNKTDTVPALMKLTF